MTFLNPLVLFGLAAAAIPVIIHLLNLRKLRTIEFSTLQFLKELQKTKMRRVKIRQWLLLALRTLLVIALVMAFARPALKGSLLGTIGTHAKSTLVILLDDSPSMSMRNERGVVFTQAKSAAENVLGLLKEGDEAFVVRLSEVRRNTPFTPVHSADAVRTTLGQMTPSNETLPYRDALGAAAKMLADSKNFNQEVYLITDGQATQFAEPRPMTDSLPLFDKRVKLFLVDVRGNVGTAATENAGISSVEVKSQIIAQDKPVNLQTVVWNHGSVPLKNAVFSVYLNGTRSVQQSLDAGAQSSVTSKFTVIPKKRGILHGYAQLEDDALDVDNKRYFVLNVPQRINVACVGASQQDTRLPIIALTLDKDTSTAGLFAVEQITEQQLSSIDLKKFDVLLLTGVKDFSTAEADRIAQFTKAGGGVMMFPGKESDIKNYNEVLFARLGIPMLSGVEQGKADGGSFLSFAKVEFEHPVFVGLFEERTGGRNVTPTIESPKVYSTLLPQVGPRGNSIISLSNNTSFLTEYTVGGGKVLLYSVEAGLQWSDFPLKGLFVPLLHRSVMYLAAQHQSTPTFIVGDEIKFSLRLKGRTEKDVFVLHSPTGVDEKVAPQVSSSTGVATIASPASSETGVYELRRVQGGGQESGKTDGEVLYAVAVNPAPRESDLRHATDEELETFWKSAGVSPAQVRRLPTIEKLDAAILESRFGVELWKYLIGLALALALLEMVVGREAKTDFGMKG